MNPATSSTALALDSDWPEITEFVADAQRDPTRHVTYVGVDEATILAEFAEVSQWNRRCLVLRSSGLISGAVLCDLDDEKRRAYWMGPWAETGAGLGALFDEARSRFGEHFDEEELAPDARNEAMRSLAVSRGFHAEAESDVLSLTELHEAPLTTSPLSPKIFSAVAALHESIFPGTHRSGEHLSDDDTFVLCSTEGDTVLGYVAFQIQPDGSGYIDYLGVAPEARGRGIGRVLVSDACSTLAAQGVASVHLTVRTASTGAVRLYQSLGFVRERTIAPYRRGFTLD